MKGYGGPECAQPRGDNRRLGRLEALPVPRLNGGFPFRNQAYVGPLRAYRIA